MIEITPQPLAAGKLYDAFLDALKQNKQDAGAAIVFSGRARSEEAGEKIASLQLEHYPGMSEKLLARAAKEAEEKFDLTAAWIFHRTGIICPGEVIILLFTAAPHREAAFKAAVWLMNWLKREAPFWKSATLANGKKIWIVQKKSDQTVLAEKQ